MGSSLFTYKEYTMYYCRYKDKAGNRRVSKPFEAKDMKAAYVRSRRTCRNRGVTFLSVSKYHPPRVKAAS